MGPMRSLNFWSVLLRILFGLWLVFVVVWPVNGLRPLMPGSRSLAMEWLPLGKQENELGPFSSWNITGTYRGSWKFVESTNASSKFPYFTNSNGNSVLELISIPTQITGVHYVQGIMIFHDVFDNEKDVRGAQIGLEGVYLWPFRQLRLVVNSGKVVNFGQEDDYLLINPYHLMGVFFSQLFQETSLWNMKRPFIYEREKHCNFEIAAQVSLHSSGKDGFLFYNGDQEKYYLEGLMESRSVDDDVACFSPMHLNATTVDTDVYYNKAINYTLMVILISSLEILMLNRLTEHSDTETGTAKVSLLMIGHQAIMDTYLCILHLTAGSLVDSLFNAFASATFFKFVVFSIYEMHLLLAIWKANRPPNEENWDTTRRELSALYSRFYAILLGGIIIMYEFHKFFRFILLLLHSFWIPQICINVVRNSRKALHPYYILGITITRAAIPLYVFGCPHNFMRIELDRNWCICLALFMGLQVFILLLQHYFGARCFIPRRGNRWVVGQTAHYLVPSPYPKPMQRSSFTNGCHIMKDLKPYVCHASLPTVAHVLSMRLLQLHNSSRQELGCGAHARSPHSSLVNRANP
ncbi:RING/U-box superfamily protein [Striga hermonthica]|uniref:RING-type E3 ubiquitin transferase n=1 Tax=Striga hermonthica TaxID=68872 RepID=A0A9N7MKI2_STRHE|nr:RING/U-box superfamily protein [Striga hermonthica]